jgi:hypothetical protein
MTRVELATEGVQSWLNERQWYNNQTPPIGSCTSFARKLTCNYSVPAYAAATSARRKIFVSELLAGLLSACIDQMHVLSSSTSQVLYYPPCKEAVFRVAQCIT